MGSYEREACRAAGAAQSLLQPFLDNQVSILVVMISLHVANYSLTPVPPRLVSDYSPDPLLTPLHFLDLLQEPDTCTGCFAPLALAFTRRPLHRDRLVHECDRTSYRGMFLFLIPMDGYIDEFEHQVGDGLRDVHCYGKGRTLPDAVTNLLPEERPGTGDGEGIRAETGFEERLALYNSMDVDPCIIVLHVNVAVACTIIFLGVLVLQK